MAQIQHTTWVCKCGPGLSTACRRKRTEPKNQNRPFQTNIQTNECKFHSRSPDFLWSSLKRGDSEAVLLKSSVTNKNAE